jgi:hypothetical protein
VLKTETWVKQSHNTHIWYRAERRYSSYSFSTSALDGGEWSVSRPGRALPPGKRTPVPIGQEAGWAPELVWTQGLEKNLLPVPGTEPRSPGENWSILSRCYDSDAFWRGDVCSSVDVLVCRNTTINKKFWEGLILLLSLSELFIWSTWTQINKT